MPPTFSVARLAVTEADALLAAATTPRHAERAWELADSACEILSATAQPTDDEFELLSEALLIAGVSLKAIGMFDESIGYMRTEAKRHEFSAIEGVALNRQEAMMQQDLNWHLRLLNDSLAYRSARPREYYRTLKRTTELLLNRGEYRAADEIAPELGRAFLSALPNLTGLARISFVKNIAQILAARGESYRALRLLDLCLRAATASRFDGQARQIRALMHDLQEGKQLTLTTFEVPAT